MSDDRTLGQYFFEQGFYSCWAESYVRNGRHPFTMDGDTFIESQWEHHADGAESDEFLEFDTRKNLADAAPDLLKALRWLREFWMPGSNHDTLEVQYALARADAALAKAAGEQPA